MILTVSFLKKATHVFSFAFNGHKYFTNVTLYAIISTKQSPNSPFYP